MASVNASANAVLADHERASPSPLREQLGGRERGGDDLVRVRLDPDRPQLVGHLAWRPRGVVGQEDGADARRRSSAMVGGAWGTASSPRYRTPSRSNRMQP